MPDAYLGRNSSALAEFFQDKGSVFAWEMNLELLVLFDMSLYAHYGTLIAGTVTVDVNQDEGWIQYHLSKDFFKMLMVYKIETSES